MRTLVTTILTEANCVGKPWRRQFEASCAFHGVVPVKLGVGKHFNPALHGQAKLKALTAALDANREFTHLVYVDGFDSLFTASLQELERRFEELGHPLVTSGSRSLHTGFFMAEVGYLRDVLKLAPANCGVYGDREWLQVLADAAPGLVLVDVGSSLSITLDAAKPESFGVVGGHVVNLETSSTPVVVHSGGSFDLYPVLLDLSRFGSRYAKPDGEKLSYHVTARVVFSSAVKLELEQRAKEQVQAVVNVSQESQAQPSPERAVVGTDVVVCYLPPPDQFGAVSCFLKNLDEYPPESALLLYSEHPWPGAIKMPDPAELGGDSNRISARIFKHLAFDLKVRGVRRAVYLETDARVCGRGWDTRLLAEAESTGAWVMGGLNASAPFCNAELWRHFKALAAKFNVDGHNYPVACQGLNDNCSFIWINGAVAVYDVEAVCNLVKGEDVEKWRGYDYDLGRLVFAKYGLHTALRRLVHSNLCRCNVAGLIPLSYHIESLRSGDAVAVHAVKTRWRPLAPAGIYYSSGDFGDIIFQLAALKANGPGRLFVGKTNLTGCQVREPITKARFEWLAPLLRCQPYAKSVEYGRPGKVNVDFDEFRVMWGDGELRRAANAKINVETLLKMNKFYVGLLQHHSDAEAWLVVPEPRQVAKYVISRSLRYHAKVFPWKNVVEAVGSEAMFIGLAEEHQAFVREFGDVRRCVVSDALDLARVIAGADWFIGNQSFPEAVACGLGKNIFQETCEWVPCCVMERSNYYNQWHLPLFMYV